MKTSSSCTPSWSTVLIDLKAEVAAYRREQGTKHLSPELRSRVAKFVIESGISGLEVSRALAFDPLTISRWVAKESKEPKCRELSLAPLQRDPIGCSVQVTSQDRAILCLPNGLFFNIPITALTAALVNDLLTVPGGINP